MNEKHRFKLAKVIVAVIEVIAFAYLIISSKPEISNITCVINLSETVAYFSCDFASD